MGGKIVTLAVLEGTDEEVAKDVAMQIAAMRQQDLNLLIEIKYLLKE